MTIEFTLDREERAGWTFTLKVHCLANQNHVHLQEIRKQVRQDLVEAAAGVKSISEKLAAVSGYLKETTYGSVKQRLKLNEGIVSDKHLIPFEYN